jgi:hypothetical protein
VTSMHSIKEVPLGELATFAKALHEAGGFQGETAADDAGNVLYFFEKPHKWADEFAVWQTNGRPLDDSEPGWETFLAAVENWTPAEGATETIAVDGVIVAVVERHDLT